MHVLGLLMSVSIAVFGLYDGQYGIENFGVNPSGDKVIFTARGGGIDNAKGRVMVREYREDDTHLDVEICGSLATERIHRERRVVQGEWVNRAESFRWLDDDQALFAMWWRELDGPKRGLAHYDGTDLQILLEGVSYCDVSTDGKWVLLSGLEAGWGIAEFDGQVLGALKRCGDGGVLPDTRIAGDRVYYRHRTTPQKYSLWARPLDGSDAYEVCEYDGLILGRSSQGAIAYSIMSNEPEAPDLLVLDGQGSKHLLQYIERESNAEETLVIEQATFSPDGEILLVSVSKVNERTGLTLWKRFYLLGWKSNEWQEIRTPEQPGYQFLGFSYWRPPGVWWWVASSEGGMRHTSIAQVKGFEEVDGN